MAEISDCEPLNPSHDSPVICSTSRECPGNGPSNPDSTGSDPSSRRSTVPGTKRLIIVLSVLLPFISGLPFLYKSTEIYRSPLPFNSIDALSRRILPDPPPPACRFHAVILRPGVSDSADRLARLITEEVDKVIESNHSCGSCGRNYVVSVTIDSGNLCTHSGGGEGDPCFWQCGEVNLLRLGKDDEAVDEMLYAALGKSGQCLGPGGGKIYTVFVGGSDLHEQVRIVVGKYRHAWAVGGNVREGDAASMIAKIFVKFFMNGGKEVAIQRKGEFMPVGLDGSIVLSFSLLNANPNDWVYDWDFQMTYEVLLAPVVETLAPVANVHIESQVLYHTSKSSISIKDDNSGSNIIGLSDLPFFVNSSEWHLDTSIFAAGRSKILQFVVYVPSRVECPLLLRLPDGQISKTNGFISPMWGGVIVWNPPDCLANYQNKTSIRRTMLHKLRLLFGFQPDYIPHNSVDMIHILTSENGFAEWELDALYRQHACYNLISCISTLKSLSNLVQSLPRMIVLDDIGKQVRYSLEALNLAQNNASLGLYDASAASSLRARSLAEDAFFHPSIESISYSSIEHYVAIYMPFFAPVSMFLIMAVGREVRRYRSERAKYMAFLSQHSE